MIEHYIQFDPLNTAHLFLHSEVAMTMASRLWSDRKMIIDYIEQYAAEGGVIDTKFQLLFRLALDIPDLMCRMEKALEKNHFPPVMLEITGADSYEYDMSLCFDHLSQVMFTLIAMAVANVQFDPSDNIIKMGKEIKGTNLPSKIAERVFTRVKFHWFSLFFDNVFDDIVLPHGATRAYLQAEIERRIAARYSASSSEKVAQLRKGALAKIEKIISIWYEDPEIGNFSLEFFDWVGKVEDTSPMQVGFQYWYQRDLGLVAQHTLKINIPEANKDITIGGEPYPLSMVGIRCNEDLLSIFPDDRTDSRVTQNGRPIL